jgi:hypothetical protein
LNALAEFSVTDCDSELETMVLACSDRQADKDTSAVSGDGDI